MKREKTALVTGAASGIGLAVAHRLAKSGVTTLMLDCSQEVTEKATELAAQGGKAVGHVVDLADSAALDRWLQDVLKQYGTVDIIVNNAGIHPKKEGGKFLVEEISLRDWEKVLAINLNAPFQICAKLLPAMKKGGWGRVVNIGSAGARMRPVTPSSHYVASKAGIVGLTHCIAEEYARDGITANCVAPGPVKTGLTASSSPESIVRLTQSVPMGRYGTPDELAAAIVFLTSEDASFVNGAVFDVNGGAAMV